MISRANSLFAIHWNQLQAGSRFVSGRGSRFPRLRTQLEGWCIVLRRGIDRETICIYIYVCIAVGAPLPLSYPSLACLSHPPPPACVPGLHTLREREKCVCFESGIISSIKSGLVPRECSVCVLACSIRDPPSPNLGQTPLLDDPRSSNPFQLSSTTAPPPFPSTPRGCHPSKWNRTGW